MAAGEKDESIAAQMRACLAGRGGEVSARNRAAKLAETYLGLDETGRKDFLRTLASFDSDPDAVTAAYTAVQAASDPAERATAKAALRRALEPPRLRLLTQFTSDPRRAKIPGRPARLPVEGAPRRQAAGGAGSRSAWPPRRLVRHRLPRTAAYRLEQSGVLLEKLVGLRGGARIRSWRDLKNRLDSDRRCYAFFHPRMPGEPLIFVEVALVKGLAGSVQGLLDEKAPVLDPREADTAIFYSISNCQHGLAGISFGNFLIKRVVEELSAEFRNLKTFATLSPIPGFRAWLDGKLQSDRAGPAVG